MTTVPAFIEQGSGEALIFLHGIGGGADNFTASLDYFQGRYRAISWDMPGYGRSSLDEKMTFPMLARSLLAIFDQEDIEKAILVGHSMGGMVAQEFVAMFPERVQALVLAGTSPAFGKPGGDWQQQFLDARLAPLDQGKTPADFAGPLVDSMLGDFKTPKVVAKARTSMDTLASDTYRAALHCIITFDQLANLGSIVVPTLCLAGEKDNNAPPAVVEKMAQKINGADYWNIARVGHLMNIERTDLFNNAIDDFLKRHNL